MKQFLRASECNGRTRSIKPFFFKDELLADISPKSKILLTGLFVFSSKQGVLFDDRKKIKNQVFPFDKNLDIDFLLDELNSCKAIKFFANEGIEYISIPNIKDWCEISKPSKDDASSSKRRALKRNALPIWADLNAIKTIYAKAKAMRLNGEDVHVDHEIPLGGKNVCGLHVHQNLRIIPSSENIKKSNKFEVK